MTSLSREPEPRAAATPEVVRLDLAQFRGVLLGAAVMAAIVLWVFWHFFAAQFRFAVRYQADWGHTLVIPLIAGYFVYVNRRRLLATTFKTTWIGLLPIVLGNAIVSRTCLSPQIQERVRSRPSPNPA